MKIKQLYVLDDMYEDIETNDNIEQCIKEGTVVHIKEKDTIININSLFIVSYVI